MLFTTYRVTERLQLQFNQADKISVFKQPENKDKEEFCLCVVPGITYLKWLYCVGFQAGALCFMVELYDLCSLEKLTMSAATVCSACLARDRSVAPLGAAALCYVYCALTDCGDVDTAHISVCWECSALLRRAARFRLRATRAHFSLQAAAATGADCVDIKPDSSLCCTGPVALVLVDPEQSEHTYEFKVDIVKQKLYESESHSDVDQFEHVNINKLEEASDSALDDELDAHFVDMKYSCEQKYTPVERRAKKMKKENLLSAINTKKRNPASAEVSVKTEWEIQLESNSNVVKWEVPIESDVQQGQAHAEHILEQENTTDTSEYNTRKRRPTCGKLYTAKKVSRHTSKIRKDVKLEKGNSVRGRPLLHCIVSELSEQQVWQYREKEANSAVYRNSKWKCEKCIMSFNSQSSRLKHEKLHSQEGNHVCKFCTVPLNTEESLTEHVRAHYTLYSCNKCDFKTLHGLGRHYEVHTKSTAAFKCAVCAEMFRFRREKVAHEKEHKVMDAGVVFECNKCEKRFTRRILIERHLKKHDTPVVHECPVCPCKRKTKRSLKQHYKNSHIMAPVPSEVYCVKCEKQFYTKDSYRTHRENVHEKKKVKLPCTFCGKLLRNRYQLRCHTDYYHLKRSNFVCHICNKSVTSRGGLRSHIKSVHEGYRPPKTNVCSICNQGFSTKRILTHHVRTHTGERPNKCQYCDATFAQKAAMKAHVKNIHLKLRASKVLIK